MKNIIAGTRISQTIHKKFIWYKLIFYPINNQSK